MEQVDRDILESLVDWRVVDIRTASGADNLLELDVEREGDYRTVRLKFNDIGIWLDVSLDVGRREPL